MSHADTRNGKRRDPDLLGLPCPQCGAFLTGYLAFNAVRFMCVNGHFLATSDLLSGPSMDRAKELAALLGSWEQRALDMARTESDARGRGRLDVAEVFRRNIANLEARIKSLRDALDTALPKPPAPSGLAASAEQAQPPAAVGP